MFTYIQLYEYFKIILFLYIYIQLYEYFKKLLFL